jgi:aminoglycoside/choline kinase family phosphotransferase
MDERLSALEAWLREMLRGAPFRLERASTDASFRRYFRVFTEGGGTRIAMDAPPDREDSEAFVRVAALLREAGLNAPEVFAQDLGQGFLLVGDLGTVSYLARLQEGSDVDRLFGDATTALVRWQQASRPGVLPEYDRQLLAREIELFPEWYVGRHLGVTLSAARRSALDEVFRTVLARTSPSRACSCIATTCRATSWCASPIRASSISRTRSTVRSATTWPASSATRS